MIKARVSIQIINEDNSDQLLYDDEGSFELTGYQSPELIAEHLTATINPLYINFMDHQVHGVSQ